ncbi:MAG: zf-HC2 domain-containing protein [Planctomycetes bacterium]|nr:zf-HC2 domain-containing protein [Planctomycetota bacterium]
MNCIQCSDQMGDYLDGGLPQSQRMELDRHLSGCDSCQQELASLRKTLSLIESLPRLPAPGNVREGVRAHARRNPFRQAARPAARLHRWALPVAAALAALVILSLLLRDPFMPGSASGPAGMSPETGADPRIGSNARHAGDDAGKSRWDAPGQQPASPHGVPRLASQQVKGSQAAERPRSSGPGGGEGAGGTPAGPFSTTAGTAPEISIPQPPGLQVSEVQPSGGVPSPSAANLYIGPRRQYGRAHGVPGDRQPVQTGVEIDETADHAASALRPSQPARQQAGPEKDIPVSAASPLPTTILVRAVKDEAEAVGELEKLLVEAGLKVSRSRGPEGTRLSAVLPGDKLDALLDRIRALPHIDLRSDETPPAGQSPQGLVALVIEIRR